jgi:hypothetical protein
MEGRPKKVKRMANELDIGKVAKATGLKAVTIRSHEQIGQVPAPARTECNFSSESLR